MVHVNGGTLNLKETAGDIVLDNRIGIVLQNGGNITSEKGSISNMKVTNGGLGIVVKDGNSSRPSIFGDNTKIILGSEAIIQNLKKETIQQEYIIKMQEILER